MHTLRFFAVEGADSFSPPAARIGRMTPIGKTRNADGTTSIEPGVATVVLADQYASADIAFLRGETLEGRLKVADSVTARALEVPFDAVKKADTLPPPAAKESKLWH